MSIGDRAHSRGDLNKRVRDLERRVAMMASARTLENASIGAGGLRLIGGSIRLEDGGDIIITGGRLIAAGEESSHRAEMNSTGYRMLDAKGETVMDLTTSGDNRLQLRSANGETNIVLVNGEVNCTRLNAEEIYLAGSPLESGGTSGDPTEGLEYPATWTRAYRGSSEPSNLDEVKQGHYDSFNGNERSLIGFDSTAIQNDLTNSDGTTRTVTGVWVYLYANHWYNNSGGTGILGHHTHTSAPNRFSADATDVVRSPDWPKPGSREVAYEHDMQAWATGDKTGIAVGPGPSIANEYYGAFDGMGMSKPPVLIVASS